MSRERASVGVMVTSEVLDIKLRKELKDLKFLEITDLSDGCGDKFRISVASSEFEGVPLLARHRKIHSVLNEELKEIHALELKTWTPSQYQKKKSDLCK